MDVSLYQVVGIDLGEKSLWFWGLFTRDLSFFMWFFSMKLRFRLVLYIFLTWRMYILSRLFLKLSRDCFRFFFLVEYDRWVGAGGGSNCLLMYRIFVKKEVIYFRGFQELWGFFFVGGFYSLVGRFGIGSQRSWVQQFCYELVLIFFIGRQFFFL